MADGMLMNFDISEDISPSFVRPSAVSSGRWKDRVRAKKQAAYQKKKASGELKPKSMNIESNSSGPSLSAPENEDLSDDWRENRLKRKRDEAAQHHGHITTQSAGVQTTAAPTQVISSLFSSNPVSQVAVPKKEDQPVVNSTPTNAPLTDGSAFTTLGLSTTLSSHLTTKLDLKTPTSIQSIAIPQLVASDSDAFIQAETGSGKTLTYLLPVVQRILSASSETTKLHRDSGCFAIILAPTRELGRQIYSVLTRLLSHPALHWIVPILLLGGEKKKSEKARLRKGGNIVVATPGRLTDHLENTKSLDVSNVRWIILDEGDRLMELGFEETLQKILDILASKSRIGRGFRPASNYSGIPGRMITMLCSATMKENVQQLGDISLKDALFIKAEKKKEVEDDGDERVDNKETFQAPAQLKQSYIVAPAKLRLVSLAAALKRAFIRRKEGVKVVVFFSCADSVDFHYKVFTRGYAQVAPPKEDSYEKISKQLEKPTTVNFLSDTSDDEDADIPDTEAGSKIKPKKKPFNNPAVAKAPQLDPAITLFKLHGSLTQPIRTATLNAFATNVGASVLFCTDVASRGLDLPNVDLVIQFDPPFSRDDYLHRIGRTARAGREGRAMIFLLPGSEEKYVADILKGAVMGRTDSTEVLRKGFEVKKDTNALVIKKSRPSSKDDFLPKKTGANWEEAATEYHLDIERWVLSSTVNLESARRAFQSHIRAYATHVATERSVFDIKALHLGHLAKAFGLRDKPGSIKVPGRCKVSDEGEDRAKYRRGKKVESGRKTKDVSEDSGEDEEETRDVGREEERVKKRKYLEKYEMEGTESSKRMRMKMKEHMNAVSEFNIG